MTTISGPRPGVPNPLRRLVARAQARDLAAFVAPGLEVARAHGLDPEAAGLRVVVTPRHAAVLLLVGELPEGLRAAVAVAYAQMPRPRAILAAGTDEAAPLPAPDVAVALDQEALRAGVENLRRFVAVGAWSPAAPAFDAPEVQPKGDDGEMGETDGMDMSHHHQGHQGHGQRASGEQGDGGDQGQDQDHHGEDDRGEGDQGAEPGERQHIVIMAGVADVEMDTMHEHGPAHDGHRDKHGVAGPAGHESAHGDDPGQHGQHSRQGRAQDDASGHGDRGGHDHTHHGDRGNGDQGQGEQGGMGHGEMGGMDMGGGGMSMVMMTKDLPRSPDGLPMEWVEAPFGPLFPGLPGGLALSCTLDGDAVAGATVGPGAVARGLESTWAGPATTLPGRMARLDPLAPVAYRLLATRALEDAADRAPDEATARARVGALERERAASHLGWLAQFGLLLGDRWLAEGAATLQLALLHAGDSATVEQLRGRTDALVRRARRTPYLRRRLAGVGTPHVAAEDTADAMRFTAGSLPRGPVARAAGVPDDTRADDPVYQHLGFAPVMRADNDAWARLEVRLAEIAQSLALVLAAGAIAVPDRLTSTGAGGVGTATVETPRGAATLRLTVEGGMVRDAVLDTPSIHNATLVKHVAEGREVADALIGVASLDLSPWEMDR